MKKTRGKNKPTFRLTSGTGRFMEKRAGLERTLSGQRGVYTVQVMGLGVPGDWAPYEKKISVSGENKKKKRAGEKNAVGSQRLRLPGVFWGGDERLGVCPRR